jgi:hypothetical protein
MEVQMRSRGISLLFLWPRRWIGVGGQHHATPRPLCHGKQSRYPLYKKLGGPQGRSGRVRKISPPTGILSPDRPTSKIQKPRKPNAVGRTGLCQHMYTYTNTHIHTQVYIIFNYSKTLVRSKSEYRPIRPLMSESKTNHWVTSDRTISFYNQ